MAFQREYVSFLKCFRGILGGFGPFQGILRNLGTFKKMLGRFLSILGDFRRILKVFRGAFQVVSGQ